MRFSCGEGQTERPRAFDRGNGWAHSAGSSTVDHDKWLQVGCRSSDLSSRGSNYSHPPRLKITPNTRRVAPKWPRGRGLQIASNKNLNIHDTAQDKKQPPHTTHPGCTPTTTARRAPLRGRGGTNSGRGTLPQSPPALSIRPRLPILDLWQRGLRAAKQ